MPYDIIYMWNLKYDTMNLYAKQKQIHRHREWTCVCQGGWGRERDGLRVWGWWMQTITFRMDKQQGPTV